MAIAQKLWMCWLQSRYVPLRLGEHKASFGCVNAHPFS
jgi:hypothetical protein